MEQVFILTDDHLIFLRIQAGNVNGMAHGQIQALSLADGVSRDTFMLTDYGAAHLYGIIPLFYSERSVKEMFVMSDKWLNDKKGEEIYLEHFGLLDDEDEHAPAAASPLGFFSAAKNPLS